MTNSSAASASLPSPRVALALEATKVAEMIEKLPAVCYPDDGSILPLLQQAGVESFFVNVRCLLEFLGIKPEPQDRSAGDLLTGWTPPVDQPTKDRLWGYWRIATKHVTHFTKVRTKQADGTIETIGVERPDLEATADEVLALWDQFVDEVARADLMYKAALRKRGDFRIWNADGTSPAGKEQSDRHPTG